jgi:hypothetical protein
MLLSLSIPHFPYHSLFWLQTQTPRNNVFKNGIKLRYNGEITFCNVIT